MKRLAFFLVLLGGVAFSYGEVFKDGETVCFFGDSITHGGRYHRYIYDYYLTRFPDRTIRFFNAGVSGDTAGGCQGRLTDDVTDHKPTSVTIMFGMNDVNRGCYVTNPDAKQVEAQQRALDGYRKNMEKVAARLHAEAGDPKLYFITPSPFDQTGVNDRNNNQPGCNDGLGRCAAMVRELAAANHGTLVDFYAPMTAFNAEQQKQNPRYTLIGPDRVHPGAPGHLMMAWIFLKAQGAPALVSKIAVDAKTGKIAESENAVVTGVVCQNGACRFSALEKALPFPVDPGAVPILEKLPIVQDLDQETLTVTGLPAGDYEVKIDGTAVGRYTAEALSKGVNLALNPDAPQVKQAQAVAKMNEARRATECILRDYAAVRWFLGHRRVNPDDLAAVKTYAETKMSKTGYFESKVPGYIKNWPAHGEVTARIRAMENELFALRKPALHAYSVMPVQ